VILASASPRRQALLRALGLDFRTVAANIPEVPLTGEAPGEQVRRLARAKARVVLEQVPGSLVLAADTLVVVQDGSRERALGKPEDGTDARRMLASLADRDHRVLTGIALAGPGIDVSDMAATLVRFAPISDREIEWYVGTGEPMDKAGAYGIQGHAALFVREIHGSWSNVVGLPVERLPGLFRRAGDDLLDRLG
jgi:septum formation protein